MAEWLKAAVLKTASRVIVTGVRIPLPPHKVQRFGWIMRSSAGAEKDGEGMALKI